MTWCVSRRLGPISVILTIHNTPILKFNLRASYKYRSKSYDQEKQLAKNCVTFSNFSPQEVNRFSQLCASLQLPLCFELHATHAKIFQNLRKTTVVVAAFSKTESLYRRISTKYKSSRLKGLCHPTRMREPMKTNLKKLACLFQVLSEILQGCFYLSKSQPSFDS